MIERQPQGLATHVFAVLVPFDDMRRSCAAVITR
jgi:hypothetical protein